MTNEFIHEAIKSRAGKPDEGNEKNKASVVWPHDLPQKHCQNSAARNSAGPQKAPTTGEALGKQPERVDQ